MAEVLQANMDWKSEFSLQQDQFGPKFQVEGVASHQPFFFVRKLGWMVVHVV